MQSGAFRENWRRHKRVSDLRADATAEARTNLPDVEIRRRITEGGVHGDATGGTSGVRGFQVRTGSDGDMLL